jgi:hypothetical protein
MNTTDTADLMQAARDLLATARTMRGAFDKAKQEAERDALDVLLDSEAAQRLERALTRLEWSR